MSALAQGKVALSVIKDFFAKPVIDKGAAVTFIYPEVTGYSRLR